ncbi:MAG: DUF4252 domain-containing protein [Bacteroidota bacterium]
MKTTTLTLLLLITTISFSPAQSDSFQTLREKFSGRKNTFCFGTSGFFARTALWMAGEYEYIEAIEEVKSIRVIVIPKSSFQRLGLTVDGYKKFVAKDSFEKLAHMKDHGDDVAVYIQETNSRHNRYQVIVESGDEVVVVEVKGYIDPGILLKKDCDLAYH